MHNYQMQHTLYSDPSAPTIQPSSRYPFFVTIAAMPHALSRAARLPTRRASARKNCLSARVVSRAKKWVNIPMIISNSSVGSLFLRKRGRIREIDWNQSIVMSYLMITNLSISERNAVSKQYGISSLYVFWPRKSTPFWIRSQITSLKISPR